MNYLVEDRLSSVQSDLKGTWSPCSLNSVFQTVVYEYFSGKNTLRLRTQPPRRAFDRFVATFIGIAIQ